MGDLGGFGKKEREGMGGVGVQGKRGGKPLGGL